MNVLDMHDIHRSFEAGVPVLDGVDLTMAPGEVVGLLGRNGAGKTTLLQFGSSVHRKVFNWVALGFIIFLVVITLAVSAARLLGFTQVWYVGALISIGIRALAHWLPLPTSILWIFCVTSWVGAYLLLERAFSAIELPREKTMNRFAEEY